MSETSDETLPEATKVGQSKRLTDSILVTGGSGLVGSHLIQQLIKEGRNVKGLYRSQIPDIPGKEKVSWVKGDILDVVALDEAFEGVEQVFHCAAIVSFSEKRKQELFLTNIEGTANVVNAALQAGVKKMCFVSSVAALGKIKSGGVTNEDTAWDEKNNDSNYGKSKYLAEVEVWRGIAEGLEAVIVNPAIILGAGNWDEGSTKIFKTVYEEFPWYTDGSTGFVDVKDVANAMIQLMDTDVTAQRFILSTENKQFKDVFTIAANAFGKKPPYKKVNKFMANMVWRAAAVKSMFSGEQPLLTKETADAAQRTVRFDNTKLKHYLPSFAYTPLEETIQRVCAELKKKYKLEY
ncbi:NAD-dependent epimerase/dehydratase family protein [Segetibacter aerophilus]|uniref:NAD-dependent epimerase n=1 Tax=Segetibacter aerophilus TaxID=670293 RepID=A0A512BJ28_9BACT|nr:NAD-dependent epimerase/dehydratase family protein [Segetibacter aerophilus]GEO11971.1 NAD-dependent epimerase [Segetibacter aerophilus]